MKLPCLVAVTTIAVALTGRVTAFTVPARKVVSTTISASSTQRNAIETKPTDQVTSDFFFAKPQEGENGPSQASSQRRVLGSQELLMLPRQYGPGDGEFPQMNHVSCTILSKTPSLPILEKAVELAMDSHPLLKCHVEGDGEPDKRIDLFQMVRKGEPNPCTFVSPTTSFGVDSVLGVVNVDQGSLEDSWKSAFNRYLDDGSWCDVTKGPLWKMELHRSSDDNDGPCALLFAFNHAISDQSSVNMLTDQILENMANLESGTVPRKTATFEMPMALEDSVLGKNQRFSDVQIQGFGPGTIKYVADKAAEGFKSPVIVPDATTTSASDGAGGALGALTIISGKAAGGEDTTERHSTLQFRTLSKQATSALLAKCRENGVAVSNALTAAMTLTSTDFIDGEPTGSSSDKERNYKVLQSLDMRRFGDQLDKCETVACMAGSMDLMHGPFTDGSGKAFRENPTPPRRKDFWSLAKEGKTQMEAFVQSDGPRHAVRVFDFAMTISDMNNLVDLTSKSADSQGRAYSAGLVNAGVYERQKAVRREGDEEEERGTLQSKHGKYEIQDVFFATSHARTGCLYQASCLTVDGELKCTFHPAAPVVSEEINEHFADAFMDTLEVVAETKQVEVKENEAGSNSISAALSGNLLPIAVALIGAAAVGSHASAFADFYNSVMEMKANSTPEDFSAALNFWIFFAVGHPILEPILWISDVLHGSPGPKIADLVPVTFLAGNALAIYAVAKSKQIRNAVNIAALAAFLAYVGAGLDGKAGLGDYNLALDDPYQGQVVKGCPSYDEVRQPSMNNFNLQKYQGKWYEQKFHDWTQFKEVYDTTLDIKLTGDGKGWVDDFGVKGPAPDAAKLSWDKSPVANGAHYFLFGRVDEKDPPGILRESGFGVEFPNYIVDVQKDPNTGEYTEAIQFQCLERGGVRVFEGINFMSRNPEMTEEQLDAMHQRAKAANMYPYGASPEQMHQVARRPADAPPLENAWQDMWKAIGFDKLLELVTESIEDGGR